MAKRVKRRPGWVYVVATVGGIAWIAWSPTPLKSVRNFVLAHTDGPELSLRLLIYHRRAADLAKRLRHHFRAKEREDGWFELDGGDFDLLYKNATYIIERGPRWG